MRSCAVGSSLFAAAFVLLGLLSAAGCDDDKKKSGAAASGRSEAIVATGDMPTAAPAPTPAPTVHEAPKTPRKLCEGQLDKPGKALPKGMLAHAEAAGAAALDGKIPTGGEWTWINFFAAWCGPCKEEIPRLLGWEKKLASAGSPIHLVFLSIDDDGRQLDKFLADQPAGGLKSALWLQAGSMREGFLGALKIKDPPELPEHVLVDPSGKVRCVLEGAVEDGDFGQAAAIVKGR